MLFHTIAGILQVISTIQNCYFLHWNFDWNSCFVMFFHEWNEWKNPQFNFSSQYLSIERNFFKWDGKVTKISHLLFHRMWKIIFLFICSTYLAGCDLNHTGTYLKYYYHVRATYLHIENIHTIQYLHIFWVHSQGARITKASHFDYEYVLGHKIVFICVATGKPRPKIIWFKDGRELYDHHYLHVSTVYRQTLL